MCQQMKLSGVVIRLGTWYSGEDINIDIIEESVFFMFKSFSTVDCMHEDISRYLHQVMVL